MLGFGPWQVSKNKKPDIQTVDIGQKSTPFLGVIWRIYGVVNSRYLADFLDIMVWKPAIWPKPNQTSKPNISTKESYLSFLSVPGNFQVWWMLLLSFSLNPKQVEIMGNKGNNEKLIKKLLKQPKKARSYNFRFLECLNDLQGDTKFCRWVCWGSKILFWLLSRDKSRGGGRRDDMKAK